MTRALNEMHDYEACLLAWSVRQSINGGTDWYVLAMFERQSDAEAFMSLLSDDFEPGTLSVVEVGTAYREPVAS